MAQTKRKRQTKHRGTAAGQVTNRGRTSKPPSADVVKKQKREEARVTPAHETADLAVGGGALRVGGGVHLHLPARDDAQTGHVDPVRRDRSADLHPHRLLRRDVPVASTDAQTGTADVVIDARMFTVGPVQENCYVVRRPNASTAIVVDPGDEADRILEALRALEVETVEAILLTHCHFDHIGAVAPVARATGAPVYCPKLETEVLADIMAYVPYPGFGPFESYQADHTIEGGETLKLAGLEFEVDFVPGHSPGHVSYALSEHQALFSGDVLFQGSVGRVDLPGGDWPTLLASIERLLSKYPPETTVHPGHMGLTTLAVERDTNPFLRELAHNS